MHLFSVTVSLAILHSVTFEISRVLRLTKAAAPTIEMKVDSDQGEYDLLLQTADANNTNFKIFSEPN